MSGIIIYSSRIREKTNAMDRELQKLKDVAEAARKDMLQVEENKNYLQGKAWNSVRSYIEDVQKPLSGTYQLWIEEQMAGNRLYSRCTGILPLDPLHEDKINHEIENYHGKIEQEQSKKYPSQSRIDHYRREIERRQGWLRRMGDFISRTSHAYDRAEELQALIDRADTELKKVSYNPVNMELNYAGVDRKWLQEIRETSAKRELLKEGISEGEIAKLHAQGYTYQEIKDFNTAMKKSVSPEETLTEKDEKILKRFITEETIESFWNRNDGYFKGKWWQDEKKLAFASIILEKEMENKKSVSLNEGVSLNDSAAMNRMITIQVLANTKPTGIYDEKTITQLENNLGIMGIKYGLQNHVFYASDMKALRERYKQYPEYNKAITDWLENGGSEIFDGLLLLGYGTLASVAAQSMDVSANSEELSEIELNRSNGVVESADDVVKGGTKTISYTEYDDIYQSSIQNAGKDKVMLGKYDGGGSTSYITKAGKDYEYFSLGKDWDAIKAQYGYSDSEMFKLFNESFLDDGINAGKTFQFSHDPRFDTASLGEELKYLEQHGYVYDVGSMSASFDESIIGINGIVN